VGIEIKGARKKCWEGFTARPKEGYNLRQPFPGIHANY